MESRASPPSWTADARPIHLYVYQFLQLDQAG